MFDMTKVFIILCLFIIEPSKSCMPTIMHEPIIVPGTPSTSTTTTTTIAPTTTTIPLTTSTLAITSTTSTFQPNTSTTTFTTTTTSTSTTTTTIPLICLNPLLQMIHRFVCDPPPSASNVNHAYTISQQSLYPPIPFNCKEEDLCGGNLPGYPDCANPAIKAGYLIQPGQQSICPDLIQVVSFKDTSFPSNSDVLLAFGQAEINSFRANPARYVELENMGYCSTTSCYCGANVPLYVLDGLLVSGKRDHFYTTSLDEAMAAAPAFVYGGTFMGIKCYIWNFNAMSYCGMSCIG